MALVNVFTDLKARLVELYPDLALIGPDDPERQDNPPFIVWDPVSAAHDPNQRRVGGGPGDDGVLMTRRWRVGLEVWGQDFSATEALVDALLACLHDGVTKFSYEPGDETWETGDSTRAGVVCRLAIIVLAPILRTPKGTRTVTAINATYRLDDTAV